VTLDRREFERLVQIAGDHRLDGALELELQPPGAQVWSLEGRRRIEVAEDLPEGGNAPALSGCKGMSTVWGMRRISVPEGAGSWA
jgi:hypothetical protein